MAGLACTEHLPAYEDPQDLFETSLSTTVVYRPDAIAIDIAFVLVNRFDETLDDSIDLEGRITVMLGSDETTIRSFALTTYELSARSFSPLSRRLTVDPGDSVAFRVRYDFVDDSGRQLLDEVMRWRQDLGCSQRLISEYTTFVVRASARLYPRTNASLAVPLIVGYCIPRPWVSDKSCPDRVEPGECP
jgi:hypothetical protein